jgi:hypothetical protein
MEKQTMDNKLEDSGSIPPITIDGLTPSTNQEIKFEEKKKKKIPTKQNVLLIIDDDLVNYTNRGLYESILCEGTPCFLRCYNSDRNENSLKVFLIERMVYVAEELSKGNTRKIRFKPKDTSLEALQFTCMEPHDNIAYTVITTQELFDRIVSVIKSYADIPMDWAKVCALLVLLSYQQHKFNWVPYLGIFGDTGSGKSVLTEIMSQLCYRCGYFTQENSADIYQYLSEFDGTIPSLAEDEIQGFEKDTDKIKIYKSGNSRNGKTSRILTSNKGRKLSVFPTYCFKILSGEQVPTVKGLNERILAFGMSKGKAPKSWYNRSEEDIAAIKLLKWDLLKWRMINYFNRYPNEYESTSRIEDNLRPLRTIAKGLTFETDFEEWCKAAIERSESQKKATLEGTIVSVVYDLVNRGLFEVQEVLQGQEATKLYVTFDSIWDRLRAVTFASTDANEKLVTNDFGEVSKNKVGRILTDVLHSNTIAKKVASDESKVRYREFEVSILVRVISNYFDEQETERLKQRIQQSNKETKA